MKYLLWNTLLEHWTSRFSNRKILMVVIPVWVFSIFIVSLVKNLPFFWVLIALISSLGAILNCTLSASLADQVETEYEGDALGLSQTLQCIARLLPSLALTSFLIQYPSIPLQAGALAFLLMAYIGWKRIAYQSMKQSS